MLDMSFVGIGLSGIAGISMGIKVVSLCGVRVPLFKRVWDDRTADGSLGFGLFGAFSHFRALLAAFALAVAVSSSVSLFPLLASWYVVPES